MRVTFVLIAMAAALGGVWQCLARPHEVPRSRLEVVRVRPSAIAQPSLCVENQSVEVQEPPIPAPEVPRIYSHSRWHEPRSGVLTVIAGDPPRPVPDTEVWVIEFSKGPPRIQRNATGLDGTLRLEQRWRGGRLYLVRRHGFLPRLVRERGHGPRNVRLTPGIPVQGEIRVATSGLPAVGARVYVWDSLTGGVVARDPEGIRELGEDHLITDARGRFQIEGVRPDRRLFVCVLLPGYGVYSRVHDPDSSLFIEIGRGATVEGQVLDSEHQPVASAHVYLEPDRAGRRRNFGYIEPYCVSARARADDRGYFRFEGVQGAGRFVVTAKHRNWLRGESRTIDFRSAGASVWREVVVARCARLECRVEGTENSDTEFGPPTWRLERVDGRSVRSPLWKSHVSFDGGRYIRDGLPAGSYRIDVSDDQDRSAACEITLEPGETCRLSLSLR